MDGIHNSAPEAQQPVGRHQGIVSWCPPANWPMQIGEVFRDAVGPHPGQALCPVRAAWNRTPRLPSCKRALDILIATPGRMFDLIQPGAHLDLEQGPDPWYLDEADHMLDLGFINDIRAVKKMLTKKHQTSSFPPPSIRRLKSLPFPR